MGRLGIRAALPAKRAEATLGNDRNSAPSKLRVCVTPAVDTMTAAAVDTVTTAAVDTITAVAVDIATTAVADTMTLVAVDPRIDTTTTAVIDITIASSGRNPLSTTDAFDTEPH